MAEAQESRRVATHIDLLLQLEQHPGWQILIRRIADFERVALAELSEVDLTTDEGIRKGISLQAQIDALRAVPQALLSVKQEAAQEELVEEAESATED